MEQCPHCSKQFKRRGFATHTRSCLKKQEKNDGGLAELAETLRNEADVGK